MSNYNEENKDRIKEYHIKYVDENKEKIREYQKKYREDNKEKVREYEKKYREENKELLNEIAREKYKKKYQEIKNTDEYKKKSSEKSKIYYQKNKEYIKERVRLYRINNPEKVRECDKRSFDKKKTNELYKLRSKIRSSIRLSLISKGFSKCNSVVDILGCDIKYFKKYIEEQFLPWMNWENRGLYNGELNYGWDLDHIIPISKANNEEEIYELSKYKNFQPLCSKINRDIKKDSLIPINWNKIIIRK